MRAISALLGVGLLAATAHAGDGVREINDACALSGCFQNDSPGYPVTISAPGSYRLTGNLTLPDGNTGGIRIQTAYVTLDLNGFLIRGISSYAGASAASCTNVGTGLGVSATGTDVTVMNGHVIGMGATGVSVGTNSRVLHLTVEDNCGDGIAIGIGSLAHASIANRNFGHGFIAGAAARVSSCIAADNGGSGVTSFSGATRLQVDGCIATDNGVDGIAGGARSLVRAGVTRENGDDGIALLDSGQVLESVAINNLDRSITVLGSPAAGTATAIGLTVANQNGGLEVSGGVMVACNVFELILTCPP